MVIDHAFILCAGFGTRMGKIGEVLPKVLWPVFEKSILEYQVEYATAAGAKNIYINSHHGHEQMEKLFQNLKEKFSNIHLIEEKELLGSGGAIHNFASLEGISYQGTAMYISGDQFLFFDKAEEVEIERIFNKYDSCLLGIKVEPNAGYNETIIKDDRLDQIVNNAANQNPYTFSGVGYFKLENLKKSIGVSSFFDTVLNYKTSNVGMYALKNYQYFDFGTIERYEESSFAVLKNRLESSRSFFCLKDDLIFENQNSYNASDRKNILNFSGQEIELGENAENLIIIKPPSKKPIEVSSKILYGDLHQSF